MQWREKLPYQDNCVPVGLNNKLLEKRNMTHTEGVLLKSPDLKKEKKHGNCH